MAGSAGRGPPAVTSASALQVRVIREMPGKCPASVMTWLALVCDPRHRSQMKEGQASPQGSPDVTSSPEAPELPTEKAFVLQLTRETGPSLEPFAGRVEHVASGRRLRFGDFSAFRAAVTRLLAEARRS